MDYTNELSPKTIRQVKNFTQSFVAEYLGISVPTLSKKENRKMQFTAFEIYKLSILYNLAIATTWAIFFENQFNGNENFNMKGVKAC